MQFDREREAPRESEEGAHILMVPVCALNGVLYLNMSVRGSPSLKGRLALCSSGTSGFEILLATSASFTCFETAHTNATVPDDLAAAALCQA